MAQQSKTGKVLVVGAIAGVIGLFGLVAANPTSNPSETPVPQQGQAVQAVQAVQPDGYKHHVEGTPAGAKTSLIPRNPGMMGIYGLLL